MTSFPYSLVPHELWCLNPWPPVQSQTFFMLQARPWLVPCGKESWPASAPWVSPVGGNRSQSEGEPVLVLSRKGKEDCPKLLMLLAVILKETWSILAWFLAPALGSAVFPRAKFARGPTVPRTEDSTAGEHQKTILVRSKQTSRPSPSTGRGCWG